MSDAQDALAREYAVDPGRSILLQAPAGSGKTAVLTQRFLRLLCTVDDPGQILAITFTRRAAAEMRARVTRALLGQIDASDPCAPELRAGATAALQHGAARGWDLVRDTCALRIQTIDSFNYWLATQLPLSSRTGGTLNVTETPLPLYQRAARRTLTAADRDSALAADAELLFERLDCQWARIERLLAEMLERRGHWLRYVLGADAHALCARVSESLGHILRERLMFARQLLPSAVRAALEGLPGVGLLGTAPEDLAAWKSLACKVLTKGRADWRKSLAERQLGPDYASAAAREALRVCIENLKGVAAAARTLRELARLPQALSPEDAQAIVALSRVLKQAAIELQAEFAASGRVDYTYVTGAAREALGDAREPTDLALRLGVALRHILVDEFQDTSLAQSMLLETLTAGWEEGDGRTLFLVGDPMQSIYRFRDAEVGMFIAAREAGIHGRRLEALRLTRNFRAGSALVNWTNEVFAPIFPATDDLRAGAVTFSSSSAARAQPAATLAPHEPVQLRLFPGDSAAEARAIAARIAQLPRDPAASIAVLVAAHAHATPIVGELAALGVESLGVDLVPLAERPVVRDLVQLARALHDLGDRRAWLAVLRAPWCGARLVTLTTLSSPEDPQLIWEALNDAARLTRCASAERARVVRVRDVLARALERRDREPPADWLESTWLQLGAADAYPRQDLDDARAFFDALAARAAAFEWRGPADFAALLQNLYSAGAVAGSNPVQIMTIHRAKGLEFDHVLVPALERGPGGGERALLEWIDLPRVGGSDLLMAPAPTIGEQQAGEGTVGALIAGLLATRAAHERTRLMYVAATRARQTLYLSAAPKPSKDGSLKPDPRSLLACLWPVLADRFQLEPASGAAGGEARGGALPLRRLADAWCAAQLPPPPDLAHLPLSRSSLEPPEFSWVGETQRHVGTLVHAWLARIAQAGTLPRGGQIEGQRAAVLEHLRLQGVAAHERPEAAQLVMAALERTLADEQGRWILDSRHREAHSELALTGVTGGRLRSVVIDRCFLDASGTRWVIDYKTSRHEGGGLEAFLEREIQRYRPQLDDYVALARALGPQPVRAALYFPLLGVFRELAAS